MRTAVKPIEILKTGEITRTIVLELLSALCGFLLSRTVLFDTFMPFGYAFVSSLSIYHVFAGLFGVIIGSLVPANGGIPAYYIGLATLACACKFICLNIYEKKNSLFFSLLSCGICSVFGISALFITLLHKNIRRIVALCFGNLLFKLHNAVAYRVETAFKNVFGQNLLGCNDCLSDFNVD